MGIFENRASGFFSSSGGGGGGGLNPTSTFMPFNDNGTFGDSYWKVFTNIPITNTVNQIPNNQSYGIGGYFNYLSTILSFLGDFEGTTNKQTFVSVVNSGASGSINFKSVKSIGGDSNLFIDEEKVQARFNNAFNLTIDDFNENILAVDNNSLQNGIFLNFPSDEYIIGDYNINSGTFNAYLQILNGVSKQIQTSLSGGNVGFFVSSDSSEFGSMSATTYLKINSGINQIKTFFQNESLGIDLSPSNDQYVFGRTSLNISWILVDGITDEKSTYNTFGFKTNSNSYFKLGVIDGISYNNTFFSVNNADQRLDVSANLRQSVTTSTQRGLIKLNVGGTIYYMKAEQV